MSVTSTKKIKEKLCVIIPAAGVGHRMKSYGPKSLIEINNSSTIIEEQIKKIRRIDKSAEIFVVVGFCCERIIKKIEKYNVRFIFNHIYDKSNVLYSIGLAAMASNPSSTLIIYGDLIFNHKTIKDIEKQGCSKIITDNSGQMDKEEVGVISCDGEIKNLSFGLGNKWCHIAYLCGKELEILKNIAIKKE